MNAKSIKEFFRPTKIKIRITLFLIVLFLSLIISSLFSVYISPGCCHTYIYTPFQYFVILLLASFSKNIGLLFGLNIYNLIDFLILTIFSLFSLIVLFYSFSCLFDFLYNSFGKLKYNKILRIGLIIVTLIIIAFPMTLKQNNEIMTEPEKNLFDFLNKCGEYCRDTSSLKYCYYYSPYNDWNMNGINNELVSVERFFTLDACESRIYCFLTNPCDRRFGENPIEGCAKALCEEGYKKYENITLASRYVLDEFDIKPGSCNLPDNNWHSLYFPENVCEKYINVNQTE